MTTTMPARGSQPAIEEPRRTAATPQPSLPAVSKKSTFGLSIAVAAVLALFVGIGVGYAVALPGRNDLVEQRDAARASFAVAQATIRTYAAQDLIKAVPAQRYVTLHLNTQGSRWQHEVTDYRAFVPGDVNDSRATQKYLKLHVNTQGLRWQAEIVDGRD